MNEVSRHGFQAPGRSVLAFASLLALALAGSSQPIPTAMHFRGGCDAGRRITIAAVGDLLFQNSLQQLALARDGSYRIFWRRLEPILQQADLAYANLEGTVADGIAFDGSLVEDPGRTADDRVYMALPGLLSFNYHPTLLDDLRLSGFDVLSTANNHALDRGGIGIDRTIANLQRRGLAWTGTRRRGERDRSFGVVTHAGGLAVGWIACTYGLNHRPDFRNQVRLCFDHDHRRMLLQEIQRLATDPHVDAVILTPHWGLEYSPDVTIAQRALARDAIAAGATAVIGTHPHVVQPWEKMEADDGREALVIFSTGNFISNQEMSQERTGIVALLELSKGPGMVKARISAASYIATWIDHAAGPAVVESTAPTPLPQLPAGNRVTLAQALRPGGSLRCGKGLRD